MKKITRLRKAWQRNWELWECKGIYFCVGKKSKYMLTPKEVYKMLKRNEHSDN